MENMIFMSVSRVILGILTAPFFTRKALPIFTGHNKVVAKVMFLQVCVILFTGGVYPSMHCRRYPSMPCSRSPGGVLSQHTLQEVSQHALQQVSRGVSAQGGCLLWGCLLLGGVAFCYGLLVWWPSGWKWSSDLRWPSGMVFWGGPDSYNKAITPEGTTPKGLTRRS